jgi:hypothetical protein
MCNASVARTLVLWRRLFLARLPQAEARADAQESRGVVGREAGAESTAGPFGDADAARARLARGANLGMRSPPKKISPGRPQNFTGAQEGFSSINLYRPKLSPFFPCSASARRE